MQEALLVVALLLQNFNFRMDDPTYEVRIKQALTIKPKDFYMRATLRKDITPTSLQERLAGSFAPLKGHPSKCTASDIDDSNGQPRNPMTILYGSNTGTCESLARKLASDAPSHGFQVTVMEMDAATGNLPRGQPVTILTSSYEGEPPDNAAHFVKWLECSPKSEEFKGVKFAVFGCGHSKFHVQFAF